MYAVVETGTFKTVLICPDVRTADYLVRYPGMSETCDSPDSHKVEANLERLNHFMVNAI